MQPILNIHMAALVLGDRRKVSNPRRTRTLQRDFSVREF